MKFDVYGRFEIEVRREAGHWAAYRVALGKRARIGNLAIPEDLRTAEELARYLDDLYHELARPGQTVRLVAD
jgi:hypothetical protein